MSICLRWRRQFVGTPQEPPQESIEKLDAALVRLATLGRDTEHAMLHATRLVVATAMIDKFATVELFVSFLSVANKNALRQALEENGFVIWNPNTDRPFRF